MRTWSTAAILIFAWMLTTLAGCRREAALQLRTDADPLVHRLKLPSRIGAVRWLAVSPNKDTGWIPPKIEFYNVYAYIELDDDAWVALSKTIGEPGGRDTFSLPRSVADVLIPASTMKSVKQSGSDAQIDGTSLHASALSSDPQKTEVQQAIRLDRVLIVRFVAR
jgi:hypothetical protein